MTRDEIITRMWRYATPLEIACRLSCTVSGVRQAAKRLGLPAKRRTVLADTLEPMANTSFARLEAQEDGLTSYGEDRSALR